MCKRIFTLAILLLIALPAYCQQDPTVDDGFKPWGSFQGSDIDSVNLENGNLMLHIPIASYPQRGGLLKLGYTARYNSIAWAVQSTTNHLKGTITQHWTFKGGGVGISQNGLVLTKQYLDDNQMSGLDAVTVTTADGSQHILENADPFSSGGTDWRSIDASGYLVHEISSNSDTEYGIDATGIKTFSDSSGNLYMQDPNGNQIIAYTGLLVDTLGRQLNLTPVATSNYSTCPNGTASQASIMSFPGYSGGTLQLTLCSLQYAIGSHMNNPYITDTTTTATLLHAIVLPNGTYWQFDYDTQGNLSKLTYPTGGTISYTWTTGSSGYITLASRTVNDGANSGTWNYNINLWSNTTVTDPYGNDTVHSFVLPCSSWSVPNDSDYVEGETDYYSGTGSSRVLLRKITRSYSSIADLWSGLSGPSFPMCMNTVLTGTTTTNMDTGETVQTTTTYDNAGGNQLYSWQTNGSSLPSPLTFGLPVSTTTTSIGFGSPGPVIRQTATTYQWQTNSNYLAANLLSRVAKSKVLDGTGNLCAETDFSYDASTPVSSGITAQHVAVSGALGNISSTTRQLSSTPCQPGATWTPVTTNTTVYDTGLPYQVTDPGGHTTTYAYSSAYNGGYLTSTQLPSTSNSSGTFQHTTSANYDLNTGLVTSYTDQNGNTSSYTYDTMERMVSAVMPNTDSSGDHGETDFYYPNAVTIERKQRLEGSVWTDEFVTLNGIGKQSRTMTYNAQAGNSWDQQDTCYDNMGRVSFKSYPYQSTGLGTPSVCSGAGDTLAYDALSRQISVTHSDGTKATTSYTGAATDSKTEGNGSQTLERVTQVDALGRLAYVCEVTSTALSGSSGTPSSCGLDIAKTGFLTSYAYDALGNLKQVNQAGLAARTFTYDSFNRLTSAYNSESGTTTYNWNNDGELISRLRPAPNVPGTNSTVTTTYAYDALHRALSQTYSDGTTPTANFVYDGGTWLGQNVTGGIGHTVYAYTGNSSSSPRTGDVSYQFDPMGRVLSTDECLPSTCTGTLYAQGYTYNLLGGTTSATDGLGHTMNWTYSAGDAVTQVQASFSSQPLLSGITYGPFGITNAALGNGHNEIDGYDGRGRLTSIAYNNSSNNAVYAATMSRAADGSLTSSTDMVNGNWNYGYDAFNRLTSATATSGSYSGMTLNWSYDRYGNRLTQSASGNNSNSVYQESYAVASNQISGFCYDSAGNLLDMQSCTAAGSNHLYTYDAEGRVIATAGYVYEYDASGVRVSKDSSSGTPQNLYLHDLSGNQIAELNASLTPQHVNVYSGSHLIGTLNPANGTVYYAYSDWLGTKRYEADSSGTYTNSWTSLPFGDNQTALGGGIDATENHFTGKEHDAESGLDYFGARYYQSQTGRWLLPDWSATPVPVPYATFTNPQSLNLYTYVGNNPVNAIDADGHTEDGSSQPKPGITPFDGCDTNGSTNMGAYEVGWGGACNIDDGGLPDVKAQATQVEQAQEADTKNSNAMAQQQSAVQTAEQKAASGPYGSNVISVSGNTTTLPLYNGPNSSAEIIGTQVVTDNLNSKGSGTIKIVNTNQSIEGSPTETITMRLKNGLTQGISVRSSDGSVNMDSSTSFNSHTGQTMVTLVNHNTNAVNVRVYDTAGGSGPVLRSNTTYDTTWVY